jgi:hypothetical protein
MYTKESLKRTLWSVCLASEKPGFSQGCGCGGGKRRHQRLGSGAAGAL